MKTIFATKPTLIAVLSLAGVVTAYTPAFATDAAHAAAKQVHQLKDGSSVYVFHDGKMAMESSTGKAMRMNPGETMETKNGQKIIMVGDEVAKLDSLKYITR